MAQDVDPYRTLGLARGASFDEVRLAYRRLAKANHPDSAGPAALPRFLAIQAAYELLSRGALASGKRRRPQPQPHAARPPGADQHEATRRAYGGRARSGPASPGMAGRTGRPRQSEPRAGADGATGEAASGSRGGPGNKATFGSTSYDGVDGGPFEPDWGGASWYGTTSGTYWTLNPKEYADPRKHGPEYQARARRAARARAATGGPAAGGPGATDTANPGRDADPTHTTASWWDSTAGPAGPAEPTSRPGAAGASDTPGRARERGRAESFAATADPSPPDLGRAAADIARALTDERFGGSRGRLVRAIIGWLPIALGLSWLIGEMTGCGRFAASCNGAADPILLGLQVAVFAVLLIVPTAASVATTAALALCVAAVSASLILSATGGAADDASRRTALGGILLISWLVGLGFAAVRLAGSLRSGARPVS
ncbi:MAG TPA: DnaJ domain-containing protein [Candidatus Limnocylindrales bacterium]|nr:DnaJ domain-containing protein [Candidatus Limnocylindrales bacterium]